MLAVAVVALIWYAAMSLCFPLAEGRDAWTYWAYFRDMFRADPEYPLLMLFRTPGTPIFYGFSFWLGGLTGAKIAAASGYVVISLAVYSILASYRRWLGVLGVALLFLNLRFFERYNSVGSETLQSILMAIWAWVLFEAMRRGGWKLGVGLGVTTFMLLMNRPANQLLIPMCLLPLAGWFLPSAVPSAAEPKRGLALGKCTAVALLISVSLGGLYAFSNFLRYDHFCIAGLSGAHIPFYRLFIQQRLISPSNGPRSKELAELVRDSVLNDPVFLKYGIKERVFFGQATQRMFNALIRFVYAKRGWDHDFRLLKDAGWEAIRANPREGWLGYADGVIGMFGIPEEHHMFYLSDDHHRSAAFAKERQTRLRFYGEQGLPLPDEGDLILGTGWLQEPGGKPVAAGKPWDYGRRGDPSAFLLRCIRASVVVSPSWIMLAVGIIGTLAALFRKNRDLRIPFITATAFPVLLATWFGVLLRDFRYPFDPIFILFFCWGLYACLGPLREIDPPEPEKS